MKRRQKSEYEGRRTKDEGRSSGVHHLSSIVSRILILFYVLCFLSSICYAQPLSSTALIHDAKQYDGKVVDYEGEVIGEIMVRGEYAWMNVYDGDNALGIWLPKDLIRGVLYAGSYKSRGDTVAVTGIFHENCLEHGGDLDIHAQAVRIISPGRVATERINFAKVNQAAILGVLCLLMLILALFKRK